MLIWLGKQMLGQEVKEEATVTQRAERALAQTPEDEEFLRRKARLGHSVVPPASSPQFCECEIQSSWDC